MAARDRKVMHIADPSVTCNDTWCQICRSAEEILVFLQHVVLVWWFLGEQSLFGSDVSGFGVDKSVTCLV